jgi:hypothetical protein
MSKGEKVTVTEFQGLTPGAPVKVKGHRGNFVFRSAELCDDKCVSVCVIGGPAGHSAFRHFVPELIVPRKVKR